MMKLFSKNSNLCDHNSPTLQTDRQTDRQTDGQTDRQTTCDRNTALCTKVHRAVKTVFNHRMRGSASLVLTATYHSYGSPRLSDFFYLGSGGQTPQQTFTQNGSNDVFSRKDVPFAVKNRHFHTP